jgi:outer membrane protein OmpA-like peptidoglycan-associated protein
MKRTLIALLAATLLALPGAASADSTTAVDSARFRPASSREGGVLLEGIAIGEPWEVDGGLWLQFARRPVMLTLDDEPTDPVVRARFGGLLHAGVNIGGRVRLGLALPVTLYQAGQHPTDGRDLAAGGVGDLRLVPQVMILDPSKTWLGLALSAPISFPTGREGELLGESGPTIQPRIGLEKRLSIGEHPFARFAIVLEGGWLFRPRTQLLDLDSAGEFTFGVGARWEPSEVFRLGTEVAAGIGQGSNARRGEWLTWVRVSPDRRRRFDVVGGVALGLGQGVGTPEGRIYAGIRMRLDPRAARRVAEADLDAAQGAHEAHDPGPQPPVPGASDLAWGLRLVGRAARIDSNVLFDFDKADLRPDGRTLLGEVARWLQDHPDAGRVEIGGHCDERGTPAYNLELSRDRAEAVVAFLVRNGVPAERLEARGYGESRPVLRPGQAAADVVNEANRRVEFRFVGTLAYRASRSSIR